MRSHAVVKDNSENDSKVLTLTGDSPPLQPVSATVATTTTQTNSAMSCGLQTQNLGTLDN